MNLLSIRKPSFMLIASLLLILAFSTISIVSYYVANYSLNQHIRTNTLPLTSDNIYSEIQRDLLQPILVSSLMANDTFVHDWVVRGEQNPAPMSRYLTSIQERYDTVTAFFVSDLSKNYYHSSGVIKQVSADDSMDDWYFNVREISGEFEINLDIDTVDATTTTLFVNHKVFDQNDNLLGVIGVGLASQTIMELVETYQARYGRHVYFIDRLGKVVLQGSRFNGADDIRKVAGLSELATQVLTSPGGSYQYTSNGQAFQIKTRFVPELNWYLIVEHTEQTEDEVVTALWVSLSVSLIVTVIVLLLVHYTLGGYQRRLELMANTDLLTGTMSRHALETSFSQILSFARRQQHPVSTVLVDVDHFKSVNDKYGHLAGDRVLTQIANILRDSLRGSDSICRWGGDEFLIVLPDCDLVAAHGLAEKMRQLIEESLQVIDGQTLGITASFGVAQYNGQESASNLFSRTDQALYRAKSLQRNRVVLVGEEPVTESS